MGGRCTSGRHWILSERRLPEEYGSILPTGLDVVVWGPNDMSVWLEAILSGELKVTARTTNLDATHTANADEDRENHDMVGSIKPISRNRVLAHPERLRRGIDVSSPP